MSDLLSELYPHCFGVCGWQETALDDEKETLVALDDVREALTNPTDEQVEAIASGLDLTDLTWEKVTVEVQDDTSTPPYFETSMRQRSVASIVRAVLAAAAGGDQ